MDTISKIDFEKSGCLLLSLLLFCANRIRVWGLIEFGLLMTCLAEINNTQGGKSWSLRGVVCAGYSRTVQARLFNFSG
jgi:hypothetical protein